MSTGTSDLQARKLEATFAVLDTNGDGAITRADFELLAERLCGAVAGGGVEEHKKAIFDNSIAWWEKLRADVDGDADAQITQAEFVADYQSGGSTSQEAFFTDNAGTLVAAVLKAADSDGDGYLSEVEYVTLLGVAVDRQTALDGFRRIDTDGDGRISLEEYQTAAVELFFSHDPQAAGSLILGEV